MIEASKRLPLPKGTLKHWIYANKRGELVNIRLIAHSDRGSQYCAHDYQDLLQQFGMIASMSRKGNCYDNAPMESFW